MHIGIDLGTTYTLTSYLNPVGVPVLVPDARYPDEYRTASVVQIDAGVGRIGRAAEEALIKRGAKPAARGFKGQSGPWFLDDSGISWSADELSALVLRKQMRDQAFTREPVESTVLTVPANFMDRQRRATERAARIAGLPNVHLVEEPIAAAMFYGFAEGGGARTVLVYDFGGGTFDVTVLHFANGRIHTLATDGQNRLGGRMFDERITGLIAEEHFRTYRSHLGKDGHTQEQVRRTAEAAKIALSEGKGRLFRRTLLLDGKPLEFMLSQGQLERMVLPSVEETLAVCERCLSASSLRWNQIDTVLLTGGSSLLPQVAGLLLKRSGKRPADIQCRHPHGAVAYGAALLAEARARGSACDPAIAVAPADLGLLSERPGSRTKRFDVVVSRNSPLPASGNRTHLTTQLAQKRMVFWVAQRRDPDGPPEPLGTMEFYLPTAPQGHPVELTLAYDRQGIVVATARDPKTGHALEREFSGDDPNAHSVAARMVHEKERDRVRAVRIWP